MLPGRSCYVALQRRDEHLWSGIPSPGEYVPLRLMASGYAPTTSIERVWTPLLHGELVYCSAAILARHWDPDSRVRFSPPLETLTQQMGQALELRAHVLGPLAHLLVWCVDRQTAQLALSLQEPRDVAELLGGVEQPLGARLTV